MKRAMKLLDKLEEYLLAFGTIVVIIVTFTQVIMRYVFNNSFTWAEELSRYIFVYLTWIGASVAIKDDKHIRITMLADRLSIGKKYLNFLSTLICISLSAFLLINGIQLISLLAATGQSSVALKLPMWIAYISIPIGGGLMCIKYCYRLITVDLMPFKGGNF